MRKQSVNISIYVKRRNLLLKLTSVIIIIFFSLLFTIKYLKHVFETSDYFKVKDIILNTNNHIDLSHLRGQNIFTIDLKKESGYLSELYPTYKQIKLIRLLPDRLFINLIRRKPLARIKLYRNFLIDEDLVIFESRSEPENIDLPFISGLEKKIFNLRLGERYDLKELALAIEIIRELRLNELLKDYKIIRIDMANTSNASFLISLPVNPTEAQMTRGIEVLEIKIGQDNIKNRINVIGNLIAQIQKDLSDIKYIDFRFKEPVIKLNEDKS